MTRGPASMVQTGRVPGRERAPSPRPQAEETDMLGALEALRKMAEQGAVLCLQVCPPPGSPPAFSPGEGHWEAYSIQEKEAYTPVCCEELSNGLCLQKPVFPGPARRT